MTSTATDLTREQLVAMVQRIKELDDYLAPLQEERNTLRDALKAQLERDPEPIVDGEHGWVATLREKNKPVTVDLISFAGRDEHARYLVELAQSGALDARLTQLRGLKGKSAAADTLLRYEMPGGTTAELRIERSY